MHDMCKIIFLLCMVLCLPYVICHSMKDARKLLADKLSDYEKNFRPIVNQSAPLVLHTALELVSIQEFDEVKEKLTITAILVLNWNDEYIRWNPADYGGLTQLLIESGKVWTPNLILTNNVDKIEKVGDAWHVIRFIPDGTSFYIPGNVFSATCEVDVTYYPWDRHKCGFNFAVWAHSENEVVFSPSAEKVQISYFSENGAWTFSDSSVVTHVQHTFIEFYLHLERKPRFVLVNVILPIIFMAYLNSLIFTIPVECGERISYSITVLLALAVFLTLVGDNLPKTSSPMSIFSYYLLTVLVVSICITLANIFNIRLYYADDSKPVKGCLADFARSLKCMCQRHRKKKTKYQDSSNKNKNNINCYINTDRIRQEHERHNDYISSGYIRTVISSTRNTYLPERHELSKSTEEERDDRSLEKVKRFDKDRNVSWKDVSETFDKIFLALSIIILTTATTFLFLKLLLSDQRH